MNITEQIIFYEKLLKEAQEKDGNIGKIIQEIYSAGYDKCFIDYEIRKKLIK